MTAHVASRPVVDLGALDYQSRNLWHEALRLMAELNGPWIRCPNLIGAVLMKARALTSGRRAKDRDDFVVLLAASTNRSPCDDRSSTPSAGGSDA